MHSGRPLAGHSRYPAVRQPARLVDDRVRQAQRHRCDRQHQDGYETQHHPGADIDTAMVRIGRPIGCLWIREWNNRHVDLAYDRSGRSVADAAPKTRLGAPEIALRPVLCPHDGVSWPPHRRSQDSPSGVGSRAALGGCDGTPNKRASTGVLASAVPVWHERFGSLHRSVPSVPAQRHRSHVAARIAANQNSYPLIFPERFQPAEQRRAADVQFDRRIGNLTRAWTVRQASQHLGQGTGGKRRFPIPGRQPHCGR